jgi:hypothetical protein
MAHLEIDSTSLWLRMSRIERIAGLHKDVEVPVAEVAQVRAADDAWAEMRGMRAPGTGIPKVLMIGTMRSKDVKDFCVVRGRGPAVVVEVSSGEFSRLVVSDADASNTVERLEALLGR